MFAQLVTDVKKEHFNAVFDMYLEMLVDGKASLPAKVKNVLCMSYRLLPCDMDLSEGLLLSACQ